jgi:hypothetical protein
MTVDVKIDLKDQYTDLPVIFNWINDQGLRHIVDWRWTRPDHFKGEKHFTFQFEDDKHAEWFSLRWL